MRISSLIFFFLFSIGVYAISPCDKALNDPDIQPDTKVLFERDFPQQKRRFVTFIYNIPDAPESSSRLNFARDKNRDKYLKLLHVLMDTDKKEVIWKFFDFYRHRPTQFDLDPTNPNIGYIEKRVERLYLQEEAPSGTIPHRDYPTLNTDAVFELLKIEGNEKKEVVRTLDLFTSDKVFGWSVRDDKILIFEKGKPPFNLKISKP